jgi:arylformamidase
VEESCILPVCDLIGGKPAVVVDLTAPLGVNTVCYPDDPQYEKTWYFRMPEAVANVSKIDAGLHSGTHVDAPLHFIEGARDVCEMPLDSFFGPAIAIDAPKQPGEEIEPSDFDGKDIHPGDIVLVRTGWGERINTPRLFDDGWPGFAPVAIDALIDKGVRAIGFDSPAVDSPNGAANGFPAHKKALAAGLPIYETVYNLDKVAGKRFLFFGVPLRIEEGEGSPVRAFAILAQ